MQPLRRLRRNATLIFISFPSELVTQRSCLPKSRVADAVVPDGSWVEVLCDIALYDLYAVLCFTHGPRLTIFANRKPALPVADPALVDEHPVASLVTHSEANQFGIPNDLIWFHAIDNRFGYVFSN